MTVTEKDERKALMEQLVSEEVMRPMDYFPHYVNASSDPKLQRLRDDHGWESVGRWWFLVGCVVGGCVSVVAMCIVIGGGE